MASIELYIDNRLCETENPENFSVYLKRQFFNPAELSTKDAQKSYDITLPATAVNNAIFGYTNVEEVKGKFSRLYDAHLLVNGIKIFDGKFKLSEITKTTYKGNLGVPAPKTVKDIFGDLNMNQIGEWNIPFKGIEDFETYNTQKNPECIFPLVLFGLLPKESDNNIYTDKNVFDKTVRLRLEDFPPSVNVIQMLKKIFENADSKLTGSALEDERLKNLYVSYKNPNDYENPWPVGKLIMEGKWEAVSVIPPNFLMGELKNTIIETGRRRSVVNFFNASNHTVNISGNQSSITRTNKRFYIKIPYTGLYKLKFVTTLKMKDETYSHPLYSVITGTLNNIHTEIKIIRNLDNNLSSQNFDNIFYRNNIDQSVGDTNAIFPKDGEVNFIDPFQNKDLISGFAYGNYGNNNYINPLNPTHCNPMAIKGGQSWSVKVVEEGTTERAYSATQSSGYRDKKNNPSGKYQVQLDKNSTANRISDKEAMGTLHQVIWLEKGDTLDIVSMSFTDFDEKNERNLLYNYQVDYTFELTPFQHDLKWLKIDDEGTSIAPMQWDDNSTFKENEIDLIKFLPSNIKINDWIDNFCKAFNLHLQNDEDIFELQLKNSKLSTNLSNIIDLDKKTNINQKISQSLKLPYVYDIGFTIDNSEAGYQNSMKIDDISGSKTYNTRGGQFYTNSHEINKVQQTSSFSYNWYKEFLYDIDGSKLHIPVISDNEIWVNNYDYKEMLNKTYFDKAQRFWYKDTVKNLILDGKKNSAPVVLVKNDFLDTKNLILDYEYKDDSILTSFFFLLANDKNYTTIECYLTPEEYNLLSHTLVKYNGDLYHAIEIDGYDPLCKKKGILKLIKQIR